MIDFVRGGVQYVNVLFSLHTLLIFCAHYTQFDKNSSWKNFAQKISWAFNIFCPENKTLLRMSKVFHELFSQFQGLLGKIQELYNVNQGLVSACVIKQRTWYNQYKVYIK